MKHLTENGTLPPETPRMAGVAASHTRPPSKSTSGSNAMIKPIDANPYDTDKTKMPHYLRNYEQWFAGLWKEPITMLEIGVHRGGSVLLWRDYFEKGTIVGLDFNSVKIEDPTGRIHLYQGLQQDTAVLDRIAAETAPGGFDIIIDDASHEGEPTRISFWHLFEHHLKPGGMFVIEDWGTGYWETWGDGSHYKSPTSETSLLKRNGRLRKAFGLRKKDFPSHSSGMVGFIKQLVDECGMPDITYPGLGVGTPKLSRFEAMHISHGQVMVQKRNLS